VVLFLGIQSGGWVQNVRFLRRLYDAINGTTLSKKCRALPEEFLGQHPNLPTHQR
jgi:hypothetical protein